ncbi:MAG TPA: hypothetical protein VMN60_00710 [Longimicrobiales bacterium]|nr:hypothetical protein [Longimicrobiales bacterium]
MSRTAAAVVAELRERGELWEHAPGLTALRGDTLGLYHAMSLELERVARAEVDEAWQVPPAVSFDTLARADYFASFPQWLTAAAQLDDDEQVLAAVAAAADPADMAMLALAPTRHALQPAVCYHVYAALADSVLDSVRAVTVCGTCWRREEAYAPLERQWAFTMREAVCAGERAAVDAVRRHGMHDALALADRLGLKAEVVTASDPFFAPSTRGRSLLQRLKSLKHELLLPIGDGRATAAASFNHHEHFFGDAFNIRLSDGSSAATGCVAFGVERWVLAFLTAHGADAANWPAVSATSSRTLELSCI